MYADVSAKNPKVSKLSVLGNKLTLSKKIDNSRAAVVIRLLTKDRPRDRAYRLPKKKVYYPLTPLYCSLQRFFTMRFRKFLADF